MSVFELINPDKENELIQYINDDQKEIWNEKEDNDYNGNY
jgi:hypothetical protein